MMSFLFTLIYLFCLFLLSKSREQFSNLFVLFGRPGCGKTTLANEVIKNMKLKCMGIDLDVCITQEMKDNFAKGIYPTSKERVEFMENACDYIANSLSSVDVKYSEYKLISFSFVNGDMRNVFRNRFPKATWILIDTPEQIAESRIEERLEHFYKGKPTSVESTSNYKESTDDWKFDDVTFDHIQIDGTLNLTKNAHEICNILLNSKSSF